MTVEELNYEELVQDGLRGVIHTVLEKVAKEGLPGSHHFYIAFQTHYPGVQLADYLLERHPEEMTIVIQHQYWDLEVQKTGFYVTLSFSDSQERIFIPFAALISFMDPHAKFGLQFTPPSVEETPDTPSDDSPSDKKGDKKDNVVTLDTFRKKK